MKCRRIEENEEKSLAISHGTQRTDLDVFGYDVAPYFRHKHNHDGGQLHWQVPLWNQRAQHRGTFHVQSCRRLYRSVLPACAPSGELSSNRSIGSWPQAAINQIDTIS
ncbi:Uncharacterized protein HZ326_8062 [Fusarium oxysporum f. sp. albedinis]|nr:Uncharacterized protein HZ326_8062 [Fusarium oxysporum f. sp. albedinis]